jgi:hypothetical protein
MKLFHTQYGRGAGRKDYPCPGVLSAQKNKLYSDTVMKMEAGFCYTFLRNCIRTEAAGARFEKVVFFNISVYKLDSGCHYAKYGRPFREKAAGRPTGDGSL